jgi:hypothetical protein
MQSVGTRQDSLLLMQEMCPVTGPMLMEGKPCTDRHNTGTLTIPSFVDLLCSTVQCSCTAARETDCDMSVSNWAQKYGLCVAYILLLQGI